jgi:hypothetical protein
MLSYDEMAATLDKAIAELTRLRADLAEMEQLKNTVASLAHDRWAAIEELKVTSAEADAVIAHNAGQLRMKASEETYSKQRLWREAAIARHAALAIPDQM